VDRPRLLAHLGARCGRGQSRPGLHVLPQDQADGRPAGHGQAGPPEASPGDLAGEGELVQPLALVAADARGQEARLPGRGRRLEPRELLDRRRHAARALELVGGVHVLPGGQEVQELGGGDGLDLLAQAVERVAVDAGQETPVAPGLPALHAHAQDGALRLQVHEQRVVAEDGTQRLHPSLEDDLGIARGLHRVPAAVIEDDPARAGELAQPLAPAGGLRFRHVAHPEQRLVDLFRVRRLRPGLLAHARDRVGIEGAQGVGGAHVQHPPRHHRLRAPLLQGRVVEERVGLAGEDPAREGGGLDGVHRPPLDAAVVERAQDLQESLRVHGLGQAVLDRLAHDRVLHRHLDRPSRQRLRAGEDLGERRGQEVGRAHAQQGGGHPLPVARALQEQRPLRVPAPARLEHGSGQQGLDEDVAGSGRLQVLEDVGELEAVLRPQRQDDRLLVGGRLQLEAEPDAELLAQGQAPGPVDARAERRVHYELHAAALVEEPLEHHALLRGHRAERPPPRLHVVGELHGRTLRQRGAAGLLEERGRRLLLRRLLAEDGDLRRQLAGAAGRLPQPEGQGRRLPLGVGDAHDAGLHAQDPPGRVAELEDVAAARLDGPVLVDGAHQRAVRLQAHLVVGGVRDGAAGKDRGQPRAPRGQEPAPHAVAVQEGAAALAVDGHHLVQLLAGEVAVGPGPAGHLEQALERPGLGHAGRDHLLGQDVEGARRGRRAVQHPAAGRAQQRRRLHELVEGEGEQASLGHLAQRMAGASHALEEGRDRAGRAHLDHQVHVADVDAQLQGGGGHDRPQEALLEALLRVQPPLPGQAAVMAGHRVLSHELGELGGDALRHLPRVHEHERRAVSAHQLRDPLVDLGPLVVRAHRAQRRRGHLHAEVERTEGARVHDLARPIRPGQEPGDVLQRLLGRGEPHPLQGAAGQALQPLQGEGQMRPALVAHQRVDLVHDDGAYGGQHPPPAVAGQEQIERLRSGHEHVRGLAGHGRALCRRGVARADADPHVGQRGVQGADGGQRALEVLLHVVGQGAQRRDVEDAGLVRERAPLPEQGVDRGQERGQRLARPGGSGDQDVAAPLDPRPALALGRGGLAERLGEPAADGGMEGGQRGHRDPGQSYSLYAPGARPGP
jgi:hypothetical protein